MKQLFSLLVLAAAFSGGCAVSTEQEGPTGSDESVGDVEQAFIEAACPTLTPDAFLTTTAHNQSKTARSGTAYGTDSRCKNAFKINVRSTGATTASVYVYPQPLPTTQSACINTHAFLRLYEKVGASYVLRASPSAVGKWSGSSCFGPYAWSDIQNIGNGHDWMAIAEGIGSDNKLRPIEVLLYSN